MMVFHDEAGNVTSTFDGNASLLGPMGPFIEVDATAFDLGDLADWRVTNGELVRVGNRHTQDQVTEERNRRIKAGFSFQGKWYDFDDASKARIAGMATLAGFAIGGGAQPENLYWHGGADPFVWVAADNSLTPMDAQTCFSFGQSAAVHEAKHIFFARALKDANPIPQDFTNNQYWT